MKLEQCGNTCIVLYIVIAVNVLCVHGVPVTNKNGTDPASLNGEKLLELGIKLKLPKLRIIAKTIENLEKKIEKTIEDFEKKTDRKICDLNPCMGWTDWSKCSDPNANRFGTKVRTRQCSENKDTCKIDSSSSRTETEFGICGGFCPKGYDVTKNGYCVKLYKDKKRTRDDAEQQCREDGGHLINIDSEEKYEDVKSLLQGFGNNNIWIDGHRKDASSSWVYKYGSQRGFFKWASGEPDSLSTENCLIVYQSNGVINWYDIHCTYTSYYVCEITEVV